MYCTNCGAKLPDDAKFCYRCGEKVAELPGSTAAPVPEKPAASAAPADPTPAAPVSSAAASVSAAASSAVSAIKNIVPDASSIKSASSFSGTDCIALVSAVLSVVFAICSIKIYMTWLTLIAAILLAGLCLLPVLLTGGIHLDGYADTCDALASHGSIEKKQQILKDPHLGAFAAIRLCCWFLASFALCCSLPELSLGALLGLFCLSRSLSGLALTLFPLREGSGLARSFAEGADKRTVRMVLAALALVSVLLLILSGQVVSLLAAGFVLLRYRRLCVRDFGGLSGDLAGWFLQTAELWMLAGMVLTYYGRQWL